MEFYSYQFLKSQLRLIDYIQLTTGTIVIVFLAVALFKHYHDKKDTKYRELALIAFIGILILIGIKINDLQITQFNENQHSGTLHLIELISEKMQVDKEHIYINAHAAKDGAIVKIDQEFYRVIISDQINHYLLEKMSVNQPDIVLKEGD